MITIKKPKLLYEKLVEGVHKARQLNRPIIVSMASKVTNEDALAFFSVCNNKIDTRTFWADPKRELILIGISSEVSLEASGINRFSELNSEWKKLTKDAVIVSDESIPATGPTILGGFSFDPLKEKTELWRSFPDAKLILPKYMLTIYKGTASLTTNFLLSETDNPGEIAEKSERERKSLFHPKTAREEINCSSFIKEEINPQSWIKTVEKTTEEIKKHKLKKVVLARELRLFSNTPFSPEMTLQRLLDEQTSSFVFAFENGGDCFIGATPERLAKREYDHILFTCLAGSMKRGETNEEDEQLGNYLLHDHKNRYEHQLVVDMITEVAQHMCQDVEVPDGPTLFKSRHIQHLFTPISARATHHSLLSIIEAMHPTPALGGYPKNVGVEKIRHIEELDRGWYAAPIGWLDYQGNGEFAAAIRSALLQGNEASLFAGVGLVADSDPMSEYEETLIKFKPMLSALGEEKHD